MSSPTVSCPIQECRQAVALDELPAFPALPVHAPCLHFVAAWGPPPNRSALAEETLLALEGNRELVIRNLRPGDVDPQIIETLRTDLEAAAYAFAHPVNGPAESNHPWEALFGDPHERNAIAREFARILFSVQVLASAIPERGSL